MESRVFRSAFEMESAALEVAAQGGLVLTPTSRLAKRYRHARRMRAVRLGKPEAWETPEILALARWAKSQYEALWEPQGILPRAGQLRYWAEAFAAVPLPGEFAAGIQPTPALFSKLQETYDLLCQKSAKRSGTGGEGIPAWRGAVIRKFESLVGGDGYRCWDEVLRAVRRAIEEGRLPCPPRIAIVTRDEVHEQEQEFFNALEQKGAAISRWSLARGGDKPGCKVYATPEQECRAACHEARLAWNASSGRDYLGIVAVDESYLPPLRECLEELSGREQSAEGQTRFNLAWGIALPDHPLFQIAVLPLRLVDAENPGPVLSSMLSSPFANEAAHAFSPDEIRGALWPDDRALDAEEALRELGKHGAAPRTLAKSLRPFLQGGARPLGKWIADLRAAWKAAGFPFRGEGVSEPVRDEQANAWEGLERSLADLERFAGDLSVDAAGALAWIRTANESRQVVSAGAESGGIQVLGVKEAFGIPFDRLWIVGCHGGVPSPRPAEPLVTPEELLSLGKKGYEEAWERAVRSLAAMRALCAEEEQTSFTRADTEPGGQPYLPSPFLSDRMEEKEAGGEEGMKAEDRKVPYLFDVWKDERAKWLSSPWLAGTVEGLAGRSARTAPAVEPLPGAAPSDIRVTQLGKYLACPFQFLAEVCLNLAPLPEPPVGISPLERGRVVHEILEKCMKTLPGAVPGWPEDDGEAWEHLKAVAEAALSSQPGTPEWRGERRWLLGEDADGRLGVLRARLEAEREHRWLGWKPLEDGIEVRFDGLRVGDAAVLLRGKIDRVDEHPELGRRVIDYKTGKPPGPTAVLHDQLEPQLLAYCAAVEEDLIRPEGGREPWTGPLSATYLPLRNQAEITIAPLKLRAQELTRETVKEWKANVLPRLRELAEGRFPAEPRPGKENTTRKSQPCAYCQMQALCGFFDDPERAVAERDEEGGE